jgi:phosphate:Na+ symporter
LFDFIGGDVPRQIANLHTFFNIFTSIIFLPLVKPIGSFLKSVIKETRKERLRMHHLDPAFLATPVIALGQATREIMYMADIVIRMMEDSIKVFEKRDNGLRKKIVEIDDKVDSLEESITPYLIKVSEGEMDSRLSSFHRALMSAVNEIENIGDVISKKLMIYAKKQIDSGFVFSEEGFAQIKELHHFALETLRMGIDVLATRDEKLAKEVANRKNLGYDIAKGLNEMHLDRLRRGLKESQETSTIHLDLISDLERINFHAAIIGEGLL